MWSKRQSNSRQKQLNFVNMLHEDEREKRGQCQGFGPDQPKRFCKARQDKIIDRTHRIPNKSVGLGEWTEFTK